MDLTQDFFENNPHPNKEFGYQLPSIADLLIKTLSIIFH